MNSFLHFIFPDSVNWNFSNSSNSIATADSRLFYASNKKIVVLSQQTGQCLQLIHNKVNSSVHLVTCSSTFLASYSSDSMIRMYSLETLQEVSSFLVTGCLGMKFRGNDLVCVSKDNCKIFNQASLLEEWKIAGFSSIETHNELLVLSQDSETVVFKFMERFSIPFTFGVMSVYSSEEVLIAGITSTSVKIFRNTLEIAEVPLKKTQVKMKNPVHSIVWLSKTRFVYSTVPGELVLVQIDPLVTQSFMNNPHTKAILGLCLTSLGLFSFSMDRFICCWDISEIDKTVKCPRSYSSVLAYTEPVWELQTLQAGVNSLSFYNEKLLVSCGKPLLQVFQMPCGNIHSRVIQSIFDSNITYTKTSPNGELLALCTANEVSFFAFEQEKIIKSFKCTLVKVDWLGNEAVFGFCNKKIIKASIEGEFEEVTDVGFEISAILSHNETVFVGTIEGNVFGFRIFDWKREFLSVAHNKKITCFDFGGALVAGSEDGSLSIHWPQTLILEKHYKAVLAVVWISEWVVSGSLDHTVQVWEALTGSPLYNFRDHQGAVRTIIAYKSEPNTIITGSDDQTVRIFNIFKPTDATSPPKAPGSHKNEIVKTLFPDLHKFIYQQTKEAAYSSIIRILKGEKTIETCIFLMKTLSLEEILSNFWADEVKIWKKIAETPTEPELIQDFSEDLQEFSFLLGTSAMVSYSQKNAETSLLKRKIHNCVIWRLLSKAPQEAMGLYTSQKLFIESLIIATLFHLDHTPVYQCWINRFLSTKKKEQAIKCFIALEDYSSALKLLEDCPTTEETQEIHSILLSKANNL